MNSTTVARALTALLFLLLMIFAAPLAKADGVVIVNTFNPGMTFLTGADGNQSLTIGCFAPVPCTNPAFTETGSFRFTPSQSVTLDSILLPAFHLAGGNDITVYLAAGATTPGAPIESFTLNNLPNTPTILTFNSVSNPILQAGTQYWVVMTTSNLLNNDMEWNVALCDPASPDQTGCGIIGLVVNGQKTRLALEVTGTPVPEPATLLLLGTGLIGLVGAASSARAAREPDAG